MGNVSVTGRHRGEVPMKIPHLREESCFPSLVGQTVVIAIGIKDTGDHEILDFDLGGSDE
jgi:transposase-like protein